MSVTTPSVALRVVDPPSRTDRASAFEFGKRKRATMSSGTIKKVVADRGFGFITAEDGKDYFFHRNELDSPSTSTASTAASASRSRSSRAPRARAPSQVSAA